MLYFPYKMHLQDGRSKSSKRRVQDDELIPGSRSDYRRIVVESCEAIQRFSAEILNSEFRCSGSIW